MVLEDKNQFTTSPEDVKPEGVGRLEKPAFWAVLPASVRYDEVIPPNAKLLYAELSALAKETGYCFAADDYFERVFGWTPRTVHRLLDALGQRGYIRIETEHGDKNKVTQRHIYAGLSPEKGDNSVWTKLSKLLDEAGKEGFSLDKIVRSLDEIVQTEAPTHYKKIISKKGLNPPHKPPQGGGAGEKPPKPLPKWKPERFLGLRSFYPKGYCKDRQKEIRAWDKLRLSDEEIDAMARALAVMKQDPEWKRGIGIPHLSTFLNGRRWEDAEDYAPEAAADEPPVERVLPGERL